MIAEVLAEVAAGLTALLPTAITAVKTNAVPGARPLPPAPAVRVTRAPIDERSGCAVHLDVDSDVEVTVPAEAQEAATGVPVTCRCIVRRSLLTAVRDGTDATDEEITATGRALARAVCVALRAHHGRQRTRAAVAIGRPTMLAVGEPDLESEPDLLVLPVTVMLPAYDVLTLTAGS